MFSASAYIVTGCFFPSRWKQQNLLPRKSLSKSRQSCPSSSVLRMSAQKQSLRVSHTKALLLQREFSSSYQYMMSIYSDGSWEYCDQACLFPSSTS